jgi:hypothetical protein
LTLTKEQEKLWDLLSATSNYLAQEFGTMVVGIGALFFAYGQVGSNPHIKLIIALVGLGSSAIIWSTAHNAHMDRKRIEALLRGTDLMDKYKTAVRWRQERPDSIYYFRATRLIEYFAVLMAVIWLELVLNGVWRSFYQRGLLDFNQGFLLGFLVFLTVVGFTALQKYEDFHGNA